jgi:hypothetical protein
MTSPVDFISGPSTVSTPGKRLKGKTASLIELSFGQPEACKAFAGHDAAGDLGNGLADDLGDERHRAAGARVDLEEVDHPVLEGILHVHQAADFQGKGEFAGLALQFLDDLGRKVLRGQ